MDKEAYAASGFEHGAVAGVLWQKGALRFAARSQANSGPEWVGKEPYFHLRSIAPSKTRDVPRAATHGAIIIGGLAGSQTTSPRRGEIRGESKAGFRFNCRAKAPAD
jgi:hypothetical protein